MKFITIVAAIGLLAGSSAATLAASAKSKAPGQEMQQPGAVNTAPGASEFAPGHLKKAAHQRSARNFAPGHTKRSTHIAAGPKLKAKATTTGSGMKY